MVRTTSNPSADGSAKPKPKVRIVSYIVLIEATYRGKFFLVKNAEIKEYSTEHEDAEIKKEYDRAQRRMP